MMISKIPTLPPAPTSVRNFVTPNSSGPREHKSDSHVSSRANITDPVILMNEYSKEYASSTNDSMSVLQKIAIGVELGKKYGIFSEDGGGDPIDFRSSAEVAEYAQTEMGRILATIDYLDSALTSMRDVDREMAVSYASLVEQLGEDGAKAFWQGDEAERKKRIDSSLDGINRMIGSVELSISVLQQAGYIIDGEVVSQREDGGLELGSFAVRFERQGFSAYFHTADRAPPADLPAGTRIEVLDGVVREITTLTTRTPFDPLPPKRLDITA